jgi:hypothetical protein
MGGADSIGDRLGQEQVKQVIKIDAAGRFSTMVLGKPAGRI